MTFNLNLAIKVLALIEESQTPGAAMDWNQAHWGWIADAANIPKNMDLIFDPNTKELVGTGTCGTGMCFAGWALSEEKIKMRWTATGDGDTTPEGGPMGSFVANYTEDGRSIESVATELFGIDRDLDLHVRDNGYVDDDEGEYRDYPALFHHRNTLDNLYGMVALYADIEEDALREQVQTHIANQAKQFSEAMRERTTHETQGGK